MELIVNGEKTKTNCTSLAELLVELKLHERRCATMVNSRIVRRDARGSYHLRENDSVEIIAMVGGG